MNENSKIFTILRWAVPAFNALYRLALLAALIWIGLGLQDVAGAFYSSGEACVGEPDSSNSSDENTQPGIVKPLLRGTL